MSENRVALLGSSRGLGNSLAQALSSVEGVRILGVARKRDLLDAQKNRLGSVFQGFPFDLSKMDDFTRLETELKEFSPHRIVYMAGGGPYGPFDKISFSSHQWAWRVSFEGAARICHWALQQALPPQMILVGSAICETLGDPNGASYAAAKHALRGLYLSLKEERPQWDLRLFSPGYLDTELLPKGAPVRYKKVWDPVEVSGRFVEWMLDDEKIGDHHIESAYPF